MIKYTIIIPVLNEEKHIESCLESLTKQSILFQEMEIMIVDGGSIDNTPKIIEKISQKYPNVKVLNNPKKIQSIAFNIGIENSSAPIVIRLDAHAKYHKDYIRYIVEGLEDKKYGNVGGRWEMASQNNTLIGETNAIINQMRFAIGGADFRVSNEKKEVETVPFGGFRREVINEIGGMNPNLPRGEDNEYNTRIRQAGYKILFDPRIVATYYARPDLKSMLKQMYANGFSIGVLMHCYSSAVGVRHLVPLLFFLSIVGLLLCGTFINWLWYVLLAEIIVYFCFNIFFSIREANKYGWKFLSILPWEVFLIHISYGLGTLVGLIKRHY